MLLISSGSEAPEHINPEPVLPDPGLFHVHLDGWFRSLPQLEELLGLLLSDQSFVVTMEHGWRVAQMEGSFAFILIVVEPM